MRFNKAFLMVLLLTMVASMAAVSVFANEEANFTLTNVRKVNPGKDTSNVNRVAGIWYLNNATYIFNFTIGNENRTQNVTNVTIIMPNGFTYVDGSNNTDAGIVINFTITETESGNASKRVLQWVNATTTDSHVIPSNASRWFAFNATLALPNSSDATDVNASVILKISGPGELGDLEHSINSSTIATNTTNFTIDNSYPTLALAQTSTSDAFAHIFTSTARTINVTFSEAIVNGTFLNNSIYIVFDGAEHNPVTIIGVGQNSSKLSLNFTADQVFPANATPVVAINISSLSALNITDLAGNQLNPLQVRNDSLNATAPDRIRPNMLITGLTYDANTTSRNLTLTFNEPVTLLNCSGIVLLDNVTTGNTLTLNQANCTTTQDKSASNQSVISLSQEYAAIINGWKTTGLNISVNKTTYNDSSNNAVYDIIADNDTIVTMTMDTTIPTLLNTTYNHQTRNLTFVFSEIVDLRSLDLNSSTVLLSNKQNITAEGNNSAGGVTLALNGTGDNAAIVSLTNDTVAGRSTLIIALPDVKVYNISTWRTDTIYLSASNDTIRDMNGNGLQNISNLSGSSNISKALGTYTNDSLSPWIISIDINETWDNLFVKVGNYSLNFTFSEYMNTSVIPTFNFTTNSSGNLTVHTLSWLNYTVLTARFLVLDSSGDGTAPLKFGVANDGNMLAMTENNTENITIDTAPPSLIMAWHNDTGHDYNVSTGEPGSLSEDTGRDYLVLKFNENVTMGPVSTGYRQNTSNSTSILYYANGTSSTEVFLANFTGNSYVMQGDLHKIRVQLNLSARFDVRGPYNTTGKTSGIIPQNGTTGITDLAGNPLVNHTGIVDVYDTVIEITSANAWTGFSIPYAINTTRLSNALSGTTNTIYTYNGSRTSDTFITATASQLVPRRGYLIRVNQSVDIPIQSTEQPGADSVPTSITVGSGWILLGVDGYLDNNAQTNLEADGNWLDSVTDATTLYDTADLTTEASSTAATTDSIRPYRAYWVWLSTSATGIHDFSGMGAQ
ncbi:MAG TPA: hypothetical protein VJB08_04015 [Candidatus Nanoarchaeia archaeon]|nr:hypothetical protein [Candidatus Nanoarchaeia archaeon]